MTDEIQRIRHKAGTVLDQIETRNRKWNPDTLEWEPAVDVAGLTDDELRASDVKVTLDGESISVSNMIPSVETGLAKDASLTTIDTDVKQVSTDLKAQVDTKTSVLNASLANIANLDVALSTRTKPADQQHTIIDSGQVAIAGSVDVSGPTTEDELRSYPIEVKVVEEIDTPDYDGLVDVRYAMDKTNQMPLFTEVANPGKRDINQASIPSDCPDPILFTSLAAANKPLVVDTMGYNSIVIHSLTAGIITPTTSHDQRNWLGMVGYTATAPKTLITTCAAAGVHVFPCTGRFVKLTGPATLVQAIVYLRNIQTVPLSTIGTVDAVGRVNQWNGTDIVNAGLAGVLAVGGNVATGIVPTTNPLQVGGVDSGRLNTPGMVAANLTPKTRRALVDEQGRFIPPNIDLGLNGTQNIQGTATANVRDIDIAEGQTQLDILYQILVELKMLNFQIQEMAHGVTSHSDNVDTLREDMQRYNYNS